METEPVHDMRMQIDALQCVITVGPAQAFHYKSQGTT